MTKWNGDRSLEILTLSLDGQRFALEAVHVREILDLVVVTEVPTSRPFLRGLINVRGKVVPLLDLRLRFGMERKAPTIDTRIVVIETDLDGDRTTVGLLADKVHEVTEIAASALEETPRIGLRWPRAFVRCVGKYDDDFLIVLDLHGLLSISDRSEADTPPTPQADAPASMTA